MAKTNDIIENPVTHEQIRFLTTSEDSDGKLLKIEFTCKVGAQGPPEHIHPHQSETFEIINGNAGILLNGKEQFLTTGQKVTVPANAPHRFWNAGDNELLMTAEFKPALRTEFFLESVFSIAKQGKANKTGTPRNLFQFGAILNEYYGETFILGPPIIAQKFLAKVIGGLGKLIGYKGFVQYNRN